MTRNNLRRLALTLGAVVCMGASAAPAHAQLPTLQEGGCSAHADPPITMGYQLLATGDAHCYSGDIGGFSATLSVCIQKLIAISPIQIWDNVACGSTTKTIVPDADNPPFPAAAVYLCPSGATVGFYRTRVRVTSPGDDINGPEAGPVFLACANT